MKFICVFCGSSMGSDPLFEQTARQLGKYLAENNMILVYGGGSRGLMGVIADSVLENGGEAIGVIPEFMDKLEVAHGDLTELHIVDSMHSRKQKMADLSDGFVTLPGGMGTLDETVEILTWAQLGLHKKPVGLLNVAGYFDPLIQYMDHMVESGFLKATNRKLSVVDSTVAGLIHQMESYEAPELAAWLKRGQT